jgi:hypothetical protein
MPPVTTSTTPTPPLANTSPQPPAKPAAPVKPAVSSGIAAAPSVCTAWDGITFKPQDEEADERLLSAIAASRLSAVSIQKHFANSDPATQARVDLILKGTTIGGLLTARSQTRSPTKSDPRQWQALDNAVQKVNDTSKARRDADVSLAATEVSRANKDMAAETAEKELALAILASPFSLKDIRMHFTGNSAGSIAAVNRALGDNAFGDPVSPVSHDADQHQGNR